MVKVVVNGTTRRFTEGTSVSALLDNLDLPAHGLAVEINRQVISRRAHSETVLKNGDEIEIVTFVGGG